MPVHPRIHRLVSRSRFVWIFALVFLLAGSIAAADLDPFKDLSGTIKISGGTAHIPVMKEAAKRIMTMNPDIQISVAGGGSGVGIKQVGEGMVDIGNSGRKPTDEEIRKYGLSLFMWAIDGVGVVVHPKNSVKSLTGDQVKAIFAGQVTNWKALGGADALINLYTRDEASGTREVFWEKALGKGEVSPRANVVVSNGAMKSAVSQDPSAIGYVSVGHMDESVAPISLDGVTPTIDTVVSGAYKVSRGLYSNTKGEPALLTARFIDYIYSAEGREIITQAGFIPADR
ncbi:MAG: phosphate ABC transporter substrate-binding protein [Desulfococcus multivorans]|nr:phosphate ABC transporter substrate-binding protein [Desulfococcus multivorans]